MKLNSFFEPTMTFKDTLYFDIYGFCNLINIFHSFSSDENNQSFKQYDFFDEIFKNIYKSHNNISFHIEFGYNTRSVIIIDPSLQDGFLFNSITELEISEFENENDFQALTNQQIPFRPLYSFFKEVVIPKCSFFVDFNEIKKVSIRDYDNSTELLIIL